MATATANPPFLHLEELHEGQAAILKSWARVTAGLAGTGGGKTLAGYFWLYSRMLKFPGESWMVGLPDFPTLQQVLIYNPDPDRLPLIDFLSAMGEAPRHHVGDKVLECRSGTIFMRSADNVDSWEGGHLKGAWLDEFDDMRVDAYKAAVRRTAMRGGWVLLTGTPRRVKWIREEVWDRWKAGDKTFAVVQFPSTANPHYPETAFEEARSHLPAWEFARLYLGHLAASEGGGVFRREWWQYLDEPPVPQAVIQAWDTAFKTKTANDYSVCATWQRWEKGYYLRDVWRARVEFPELEAKAVQLYGAFQPSRIIIEDAASGQSLIQALQRSTHLPIIPFKVDSDKRSRAAAVTGLIESGRVFLPRSAPWLHDFVEEHAEFPSADVHDDQVDTTVMALTYFLRNSQGFRLWV